MEEVKQEVIRILQFLQWQIKEGKCTDEELESIHKVLAKELKIDATIEDLAEHYGQSQSNVRNVIHRRMTEKPKRKVLFNFLKFSQIIPEKWKR